MPMTLVLGYQCLRCEHRWLPRGHALEDPAPPDPKTCPKCRTRQWATPLRFASDENEYGRTMQACMRMGRTMKKEGKTWTEIGAEVKRQFGVRLDKDQLRALLR